MLALYLQWLVGQGMARNTVEQRVKFARLLLVKWGTFDRSAHEVVAWLDQFRGWTRVTYYNHLTSLYAFLVETGVVTESPLRKMKRPTTPNPAPNPLSPAELRRVIDAADDRMRAWLLLGCLAGLRAHEIAKVHGADITESHLVVDGKGGVMAVIPTHERLWELAQGYPRDDWWFPSPHRDKTHVSMALVSNSIRDHFRACGITGKGAAHRLRYSFGTNLARAGVNMRVTQELLRHKSLETTERYIYVADEERRSAIAGLVA